MTIDINTLHIGSHVLIDGQCREVFGLGCGRVSYLPHPVSSIAESVLVEDVEPIPITEELLTELGFKKEVLELYYTTITRYIDAETAKCKAEGTVLIVPRITIQYINVTDPFWDVSAHGENMEDNKATVRYLHELEAFLYLTTKTELIKE